MSGIFGMMSTISRDSKGAITTTQRFGDGTISRTSSGATTTTSRFGSGFTLKTEMRVDR
jgi:hypothetical protein